MSRYVSKKSQEEQKRRDQLSNQLQDLKNKLQQDASQLKGGESEEDRLFIYGPPVSPKEFINSPDYYGNKDEIYPWIIEDMEEIFSGRYHAPKYHTVVELAGTGSGKAWLAGFIISYMWYWLLSFKSLREYFSTLCGTTWMDNDVICFANMAPTGKQAKDIVFDKVTKILNRIKILRERKWLPDPHVNSELIYKEYDPTIQKEIPKISIWPGNSSNTLTLGHAIIGSIIDEACFWETKEKDPVEDLYATLNDRRYSRFKNNGVTVLISSAWTEGNYAEKLALRAENDPGIFYRRRSRYHCKPEYFNVPTFDLDTFREKADGTTEKVTLHPPLELKSQYDADKSKALRDIDAIPSVAGSPFYSDFQLVMSRINHDRSDPCPDLGKNVSESPLDVQTRLLDSFRGKPGCKYKIHNDLAKGSIVDGQCGVGFAMVHPEYRDEVGTIVVLDLAVRFKAPAGKEVDLIQLLDFIKWLKIERGFDIDMVTFDQWNSLLPKQTINSWNIGIVADQYSVDYKAHTYMKNLIRNNQFDFYNDQNLLFELKRLEDYQTSVAPGLNSFKDESDAVAGAIYNTVAKDGPTEKVIPPRSCRIIKTSTGGALGVMANIPQRPGQYRKDTGNLPKFRQINP